MLFNVFYIEVLFPIGSMYMLYIFFSIISYLESSSIDIPNSVKLFFYSGKLKLHKYLVVHWPKEEKLKKKRKKPVVISFVTFHNAIFLFFVKI